MALPILETASYELTLPSTDVKVKFRPFKVAEEKVLLQALESQEQKQIVEALKNIVSVCTFGNLNVDELPTFDLEYVFLQIRSKSVGEVANLKILCPDDKKTYADVNLDLTEVSVQVGDDHTNKIELTDGMGVIMTYPTIDSFLESGIEQITANNMLDVIGSCILQIYENNGEKVYQGKDQTKKELEEFIESMNSAQFKKVQSFFDTMPKLSHKVKVKNPKTKKVSEVTLSGLNDFFA